MAPHKGRRHYVLFQSSVRAQSADLDITNRDTDAGVKLFLCMTEGGAERRAARPELTLGDTQTCPRSARTGMSISTQHASYVFEKNQTYREKKKLEVHMIHKSTNVYIFKYHLERSLGMLDGTFMEHNQLLLLLLLYY